MNKMYRVFVSSTYLDLKEERKIVMESLIQMDCLPVGMEMFPASNDRQMTLIKKAIDSCDLYILLVAGRYGTIAPDMQISYTEQEYEYARSKNKLILPFLYEDMENLPARKLDKSAVRKKQLLAFRERIAERHYYKSWIDKQDLQNCISVSLHAFLKEHTDLGYSYGNEGDTSVALTNNFNFREVSDKMVNAQETYVFALGCTVTMPLLKDRTSNMDASKQPKFRFLLMQPDGDAVKLAAMRAGEDIEDMINTYRVNMKKVCTIPNSELRTLDYLPPYNIFIFNPNEDNAEMIVHIAGWKTPSENSRPALRINKSQNRVWFDYFLNQFNKMWEFAK